MCLQSHRESFFQLAEYTDALVSTQI